MNSTYVITGLAVGLAALAPTLSAIERRAVGEPPAAQQRAGDERSRFLESTERELEELDTRIDELRAKAKEKGREGRRELERQAERLDRRRERAEKRLQELRTASGDRWRQFRAHVSDLVEELREDVRELSRDEETSETSRPR